MREYVLNNNIRLVVKPTDFKNDEILINAFLPGGISLAPDEAVFAASVMPRMIQGSGIGEFSAVDLQKKLAGQQLNLQPLPKSSAMDSVATPVRKTSKPCSSCCICICRVPAAMLMHLKPCARS
ncbi:MAG: hypothetical protein IPM52_00375 [Bacteroidetes bacterium]|nr:hypothetical protein [Bacteroidota bacterium]